MTLVTFRTFKPDADGPGGDVIAIFPSEPGARLGFCGSYQTVGQHGDCDPIGLTHLRTRLATPAEYGPLLAELHSLGYELRIVRRLTRRMFWWNAPAGDHNNGDRHE